MVLETYLFIVMRQSQARPQTVDELLLLSGFGLISSSKLLLEVFQLELAQDATVRKSHAPTELT